MLIIDGFSYLANIQGDAEGMISTLGGDTIGHCEEKSSEHVSNSE
jgi:hypothetical protein